MTERAITRDGARRMGFFTDTTTCIGCKACEVACKQWNDLPADGGTFDKGRSYDHTGALSGDPNVAIQESKAFTCDVRAGGGSEATRKLAGKPPGDPVRVDDDHFAEERPQA